MQAELAAARARLAVVERQRSFGTASDVELLRAQLSVKETELDLQRLGLQLQARKAPDPR